MVFNCDFHLTFGLLTAINLLFGILLWFGEAFDYRGQLRLLNIKSKSSINQLSVFVKSLFIYAQRFHEKRLNKMPKLIDIRMQIINENKNLFAEDKRIEKFNKIENKNSSDDSNRDGLGIFFYGAKTRQWIKDVKRTWVVLMAINVAVIIHKVNICSNFIETLRMKVETYEKIQKNNSPIKNGEGTRIEN